jgi:hypothetical protein
MNRRQFFKALGSSAGAIALSAGGIALLEQELWQPTKAIFLPPQGGWVARPTAGWEILGADGRILTSMVSGPVYETVLADFHRLVNRPKRYVVTVTGDGRSAHQGTFPA